MKELRRTTVRAHKRRTKRGVVPVRRHNRNYSAQPFSTKKGVFHLPIRTAIIVPSTTNKDEKISRADFQKRINETRAFLSRKNGGYTSVRGVGGYVKQDGGLVKENVAVVESYTTKQDFVKNKKAVESFLKRKGREWGQESMGYEHEDDLYYVDA